uniref:Cas scaffold protein family member 4 n=1 Tax=Fundulus heteroclitus TaxID=8078 RepID=A0A3Q2TJY3_FUNHE
MIRRGKFAKALYDNTAECADELAFRKGDIVTVMDQNVANTSGWWMCSLYGRHGLAPANRLELLSPTVTAAGHLRHDAEKATLNTAKNGKNIYQIPSVPRPISSPAYEIMDMNCWTNNLFFLKVYVVQPPLAQDPNYDIPVPSGTEYQHKITSGFSTLPTILKHERIYDVPAGPEKAVCRNIYQTLPVQRASSDFLIYDTPKPCTVDLASPPKLFPQTPFSNRPPSQQQTEDELYAFASKEDPLNQVIGDHLGDHKPLERRGDPSNTLEIKKVRLQRMRNFLACTSFHDLPESLSAEMNQRISTASSSSTSSCDSLPLSSSSPELHREVTLNQEEACRKLRQLQESVCGAVPQLMDFVSSNWRCKKHLEEHLNAIKEATERIVSTLTCFLNFVIDLKGNARRLTDTNLQTRLHKQLSIVEDSGVILQQTESSLNAAGWNLDRLCQDPGQVQNPDQLDRFVMVARTVPDDVKRLVSIIYGNSKLLFKAPQQDPEPVSGRCPQQTKKSPDKTEQGQESEEDDNDYVESSATGPPPLVSNSPFSSTEEHQSPSLSEHCRLYFGALQKAIGGFVESLENNHPPEKFISQSKLVIMVGQRLVDTLCREAARRGSCQSLLCKSNHLCALLKQLAVATKKAAVHYPDKQALLEVQEFAKELAQRALHFRTSLAL